MICSIRFVTEEISRQLIDSDSKILFGTAANYPVLKQATSLANKQIPIVCVRTSQEDSIPDGAIDYAELANPTGKNSFINTLFTVVMLIRDSRKIAGVHFSNLKRHCRHPDDVVFLPYSSGTTGLPKGVELTHTNIISNSEMLKVKAGCSTVVLPTTDTFQDVLPCVLPFFHIYGLTVTLISKLQQGCKLITLPAFRPDTFLNSLTVHKGSVLHLVPPISK